MAVALSDPDIRRRVLSLALGVSTRKEIADILGIHPRTIARYCKAHPQFDSTLTDALRNVTAVTAEVVEVLSQSDLRVTRELAETSTRIREGEAQGISHIWSIDDHAAFLKRIMTDPTAPVQLRNTAMIAFSKVLLSGVTHAAILRAERDFALEKPPGTIDVEATEVAPGPLVFAAIPANGSEGDGRGPAEIVEVEDAS